MPAPAQRGYRRRHGKRRAARGFVDAYRAAGGPAPPRDDDALTALQRRNLRSVDTLAARRL